ncbi:hypothetical protein [Chamaesiphon sp.]|uniref:hypothetical protein n=1 Tax=Chamaesiphon sp. TaxID=2814140 RepID=UPI0035948A0E
MRLVSGWLSVFGVNNRTIAWFGYLLAAQLLIFNMLKYSVIAGTTAIINLVLVLTNPPQIVNAVEFEGLTSISHEKLIIKDTKSIQIDAKQQSDLQGIHETLTQYYRGFNEYNIDRMERVSISVSPAEKKYLQGIFAQLRAAQVDMSVEVQNIELVSLTANNALINVEQVMKTKSPLRSMTSQQSASVMLTKYRGKWKISDGNTVVKSIR